MRSPLHAVLAGLVPSRARARPSHHQHRHRQAINAHRSSTRGPLNARLGLRRVLLPAAFHASRHEHVASAHRPPLLFFFGVACARQLHQHGDLGRVAPQARRCVLRRQPRRPAARVDRGAATLALRSAPGPSRYAPHCVLLLLARQGAPHRRGSLGERPSPRTSRRGTAGACLDASAQPRRAVCTVSALISTRRAGAARGRSVSSTRATRPGAPPACPCPVPSTVLVGLERSPRPASVRHAASRSFRCV